MGDIGNRDEDMPTTRIGWVGIDFGPDRIIEIPRSNLPQDPAPEPGMALSAQQQDGSTATLVITEVGEDSVKADANHPLAGEDLTFDLTLRGIKQAG